MKLVPYKSCVGRKYRPLPKLYRPFALLISSSLCNNFFLSTNKVRFINQIFRWFYKSRWGYKISINESNIKNDCNIINGSHITLCTRTQKAAFKNLLVKLNYKLIDYDILKRRQYVLYFSFLFLDIDNLNILKDNIYVDIQCFHEDKFKIFFILNGHYLKDFKNILYYYDIFVYNKFYNYFLISEVCNDNFLEFSKKIDLENYDINDI